MKEQEAKDLWDMKDNILQIQTNFFDYATYIDRWTPQELLQSGYRNMSNAEAMQKAFRDAQSKIDKLHKEYFKKYPD